MQNFLNNVRDTVLESAENIKRLKEELEEKIELNKKLEEEDRGLMMKLQEIHKFMGRP